MVLVAEDVGQHGEAVAFLDQAHGDAGDRRLERHARIHHRQRGAADRRHRGRAVRLGDLRDHADRVGEVLLGPAAAVHRAPGQLAVADLAPARRTEEGRLADRVGREVVVQQEMFAVLAFERVDDLLVLPGAQRRHNERLGLAASKQGAEPCRRGSTPTSASRSGGRSLVVAAVDARAGLRGLRRAQCRFSSVLKSAGDGASGIGVVECVLRAGLGPWATFSTPGILLRPVPHRPRAAPPRRFRVSARSSSSASRRIGGIELPRAPWRSPRRAR